MIESEAPPLHCAMVIIGGLTVDSIRMEDSIQVDLELAMSSLSRWIMVIWRCACRLVIMWSAAREWEASREVGVASGCFLTGEPHELGV